MQETQVWFLGQEDPLEKEMAIHSSTLAWKIPWTEEPDRLQSMGLQRVGHDWAIVILILNTFLGFPGGAVKESACQCRRYKKHGYDPWVGKILWRRKWQPTLVFLPRKFHGQRSLVGYNPRDHKVLDKTRRAHTHTHNTFLLRCPIAPHDISAVVNNKPNWLNYRC